MKTPLYCALVLSAGLSCAAMAADNSFYVSGSFGQNRVDDQSIERTTLVSGHSTGNFPQDIQWQNGQAFNTAFGYQPSENIRLELEFAHRNNSSSIVKLQTGNPISTTTAHTKVNSLMANAIYVFRAKETLKPYAGIGIGAARTTLEVEDSLSAGSDSATAFAAQAIAGLDWAIARQWSLFAQYQYFMVKDPGMTTATSRNTTTNLYVPGDYNAQSLSIGARFNF